MRTASALMRDRDSAHDLDEVARWLADRDDVCRDEATTWMVRATSLPTDTLASLWTDRMWSRSLTDLVVQTADGSVVQTADGSDVQTADDADEDDTLVRGFLRGVAPGRGVGVLGLDGQTRWVTHRRWMVPHPALLPDLPAWQSAARQHGIRQDVHQLDRTVFHRDPVRFPDEHTAAHLWLPAMSGERTAQLWDGGRWVLARITPADSGAVNGESSRSITVTFADSDGRLLRLAAVGPIVWSEALRLATA
jgi:hypothetical protein